jgi:uncharacterized protein (TIGR01244 family)
MRALVPGLVLLVSSALFAAEVPSSIKGVPDYHVVRPNLATAGQPSPEALKQLKDLGFKTVINLRTEGEGAKDEEPLVRELGLRYVWVPVTPQSLSAKDVDDVAAVLNDESAGPVLLHCASANRAGALVAAVSVRNGKTIEEAEAEGARVGLTSDALKAAVRRVSTPPAR